MRSLNPCSPSYLLTPWSSIITLYIDQIFHLFSPSLSLKIMFSPLLLKTLVNHNISNTKHQLFDHFMVQKLSKTKMNCWPTGLVKEHGCLARGFIYFKMIYFPEQNIPKEIIIGEAQPYQHICHIYIYSGRNSIRFSLSGAHRNHLKSCNV